MAIYSVASAASDTQLRDVNSAREGLIITNTDAYRLYIGLDGTAVTTSNYSFYLDAGDTFTTTGYKGEIRGLWAADGSGAALITTWGR